MEKSTVIVVLLLVFSMLLFGCCCATTGFDDEEYWADYDEHASAEGPSAEAEYPAAVGGNAGQTG